MSMRPRLSLCIPTYNRANCLRSALESAIQEVASHPPGIVEIFVSDNASTDETPEVIAQFQAMHPELRASRNAENLGFDRNYLRCVDEARGEFVWILGDDDIWMPGSVGRVIRELDAGADACLVLSQIIDAGQHTATILPWFLDPQPPLVWDLQGPEYLRAYFDACARNAAVFAFISVAIIRRDRLMEYRESTLRAIGTGYAHLWGMMEFLLRPCRLHYIPEALIQNRLSDTYPDSHASRSLFSRWMHDLYVWTHVAEALFGDYPEVQTAFFHIVGRNHHDTILPGLRQHAASEAEWRSAIPYLERAGFSRLRIAATDLGFQCLHGRRQPAPTLGSDTLCLADLAMVARGARLSAVLALGEFQDLLDGAGLLAALRSLKGADRILVFCRPETAGLFAGFEVIPIDSHRYLAEESYRDLLASALKDEPIDLLVNLDPQRSVEADDLCAIIRPVGGLAFQLPERGQSAELVKALNEAYTCLLPADAGVDGLRKALDLPPAEPALWPAEPALEEARGLLAQQGWESPKTMAILLDHPSIAEEPAFQAAFDQARESGWTFIGIGGRGSRSLLADLCGPLEDRAVNLSGALDLGSMAALLQHCGAFIGGTPLVQALARACGCRPYRDTP